MRTPTFAALALSTLLTSATFTGLAQDPASPTASSPRTNPPEARLPESAESIAIPEKAQLEQQFKETLTKSIFSGKWCLVTDGELGEEHAEKYTVQSANKIGSDLWLIYARVQYGKKDILVPVPVSVKWAGDTPVISITKLGIPGLGTYTARVVVYDSLYAGTWSGSDHGGQLHGVILKQK